MLGLPVMWLGYFVILQCNIACYLTEIRKVLTKLSKEKNSKEIATWIRPCENHLYWCAMSTKSGDGNLIWAKFKSFLSHMINVHENLDDPLFNKCGHGQIRHRTWLEKGMMILLIITFCHLMHNT